MIKKKKIKRPRGRPRITNPKGAGRKTVMTPETIAKLESAFAQGFSDADACILAEIDVTTLHRYNQKNPNFAKKKEALKRRPLLSSVLLINKAIREGDVTTAKWYAERKGKDEFSVRNEITGKDNTPIQTIVLTEKELEEARKRLEKENEK